MTEIIIVAPVSAGFGVMDTALITGAVVSSVPVIVTVDALPAESVAVTMIVFAPFARVSALQMAPALTAMVP